ncbi:MAG TPA: phage head-tail connector protein [Allosphingosinicella sp.]|nr:phage head-tail connector protein [Allosphingosinicella sp.]
MTAEAPPLPAPLAELKAFLRIATGEEDALLAGLMRAAADTCEAFTGRALLTRAVEETLRASRAWTRLGAAPVAAIDAAALLGADGAATPLGAGDYAIDIDAAGEGWVRLLIGIEPKRVRVSYRAGMAADPNGLPEALRHGIVRLAAYFYMHRDREEPPAAVAALWRPWRRLRLV